MKYGRPSDIASAARVASCAWVGALTGGRWRGGEGRGSGGGGGTARMVGSRQNRLWLVWQAARGVKANWTWVGAAEGAKGATAMARRRWQRGHCVSETRAEAIGVGSVVPRRRN